MTSAGTSQSPTVTHTHASTSDTSTRSKSLPGQAASSHRTTGTGPKTRHTSLHDSAVPVANPIRQGKIDEQLAKMFAADLQPFKIVENKGFKQYNNAVNPSYTHPSRKIVTRIREKQHH